MEFQVYNVILKKKRKREKNVTKIIKKIYIYIGTKLITNTKKLTLKI